MNLREKALGLAGVTHGGCPEGSDCRACARNVARIEAVLAEVAEAARAEGEAKGREAEREAHRPVVEAATEAREVLALCTTRRSSAPEDTLVAALGESIGFGALMSAASRRWACMFDGTQQEGSQHTSGPAEATVKRTLTILDKALARRIRARGQRGT
jgi:hypothetical protein